MACHFLPALENDIKLELNLDQWLFAIVLIPLYLAYLFVFRNFILYYEIFNVCTYFKLLAFCAPIYIFVIIVWENHFSPADFGRMFLPLLCWLVSTLVITGGKSEINFYLLEPLLSLGIGGLYVFKGPLKKYGFSEAAMRNTYFIISGVLVLMVVLLIPPYGG